MPELPEVETVARGLKTVLVGQTIQVVEVLRDKSMDFEDARVLIGAKILDVRRKAKILIVDLETDLGPRSMLIHLKMTGQLIYDGSSYAKATADKQGTRLVGGHPSASWVSKLPDRHTRVVIKLSEGTLFFNDMRVFGWVRVADEKQLEREFANYGPDIISDEVDEEYFYSQLQRTGRAVKLAVLDQGFFAGVGNIYANDGLWDAQIDPRVVAKDLSKEKSDRLLQSLKKVVNLGIELGGATTSDGGFVNTEGLGGRYQERFLTYELEGEACQRKGCSGIIEKIIIGGRGTYFCPVCQE